MKKLSMVLFVTMIIIATVAAAEVNHKQVWGRWISESRWSVHGVVIEQKSTVAYVDDVVFDLSKINIIQLQQIRLKFKTDPHAVKATFRFFEIDQATYASDHKSVKILRDVDFEPKTMAKKVGNGYNVFTSGDLYNEILNYWSDDRYILIRIRTEFPKGTESGGHLAQTFTHGENAFRPAYLEVR